jgi:hypothetical protein
MVTCMSSDSLFQHDIMLPGVANEGDGPKYCVDSRQKVILKFQVR